MKLKKINAFSWFVFVVNINLVQLLFLFICACIVRLCPGCRISIQLLFLLIGGRGSTKSSFISHFNTTLVFINHPDLLLVSGFLFYFNTTLVFINPCGRSLSPLFPRISIQLLFLLISKALTFPVIAFYFNTTLVFINPDQLLG